MAFNGGSTPTADQAQHSVEFLSNRFTALFAQLHREEAELKAVTARNELLERRLLELRRREEEQVVAGQAEIDGRLSEVAQLRIALEAEEQRASLGGDEAGALAAVTASYSRQAESFLERRREEQAREQSAYAAAFRQGEELRQLQAHCAELRSELSNAEASRTSVTEELRVVTLQTSQAAGEVSTLEYTFQEEQRKYEVAESRARLQQEELRELEQKVSRSGSDCEELARRLDFLWAEGRDYEGKLLQYVEQRSRAQEEFDSVQAQLRERRRESSEYQVKFVEQTREVQKLREQLQAEQTCQRQEQQISQEVGARLEKLHADVPIAERALHNAEAEFAHMRQRCADLEERCGAQQAWRDEQRQKRDSSEVTIGRLREELRQLSTKRVRMQQEVDEAALERTRLEVEVEVMAPALQDVWRRCRELEDKLAARVQELGLEADKVRRCRAEACAARARLNVLERHNEAMGFKLRDYQSAEKSFGLGNESLGGDSRRCSAGHRSAQTGVRDKPPLDQLDGMPPRPPAGGRTEARLVSPSRKLEVPQSPPLASQLRPSQPQSPYRGERRVQFVPEVRHGSPISEPQATLSAITASELETRGATAVPSRAGVPWERHLPNPAPPPMLLGGPGSPARSSIGGSQQMTTGLNANGFSTSGLGGSTKLAGDATGAHLGIAHSPHAAAELAGSTGVPKLLGGDARNQQDAVKFLCEFVAREEERLGLTPRSGRSPAGLGCSTPTMPALRRY